MYGLQSRHKTLNEVSQHTKKQMQPCSLQKQINYTIQGIVWQERTN